MKLLVLYESNFIYKRYWIMGINKIININNNERKIGLNMVVSGICKPLSMIISYIYVPIVLNYLGVEKYGIWSTILTILTWIGYFDIGIGNGLRNKLTESLSNNENNSKKLVSSAYAFTAAIMISVIVVFICMSNLVNWNIVFGVNVIDENLRQIVCINVFFVAINFIFSLYKNALFAVQKASYVSLVELLIQIINLLSLLVIRRHTRNSLLCMTIIYGAAMTITNVLGNYVVYKKNKELAPSWKYIDFKEGRQLTGLGIQFFVIQVCALVLFSTDSILISYLYGAANVTSYSTVNKLFSIISGIYIAMLTPIWSAVTKNKAEGNLQDLEKIIKRLQLLMIPFAIGVIAMILIFRPMSYFWLGKQLNYGNGIIVLGGIYCVLTIWCNTFACISNGLELMNISMTIAVLQAVMNIPLSYYFAEKLRLGSAGILLGTICVMLFSALGHPLYVYKYVSKNRKVEER